MPSSLKILAASAVFGALLLAGGCSSGEDPALNTKAPPASSGAQPEAGNPNKKMPGANSMQGGGSSGPGNSGTQSAVPIPPGGGGS